MSQKNAVIVLLLLLTGMMLSLFIIGKVLENNDKILDKVETLNKRLK